MAKATKHAKSAPGAKSSAPGASAQATWGGRFATGPAALMLQYSESVSFDRRLAPFDIAGSQAHAKMLARAGLLTTAECDAIVKGLDIILLEIQAGLFNWDTALEDVHMNIERALTKITPAGAKLHAGRSRNDQVATAMRLWFKWSCAHLYGMLGEVLRALVTQAEAHQKTILPGYTHLQRAQPVTVAHHLLAYAEMFGRDRARFIDVAEHANVCPLGSGAIAGTTLPIDRASTARELGFVDSQGQPRLTPNSMDAVADRDVFVEFLAAAALCGAHASRVAEDLILWSSAEFRFAALPEAFTTGSSLMPQKKNPDALELLRGKSARLQGNLQTLLILIKGLPLTYNRDLQEDKPPVFDSFDQLSLGLQVLAQVLAGLEVNAAACAAAASDPLLLATDLADHLVMQGVPFRDAHHAVGALVALAEKSKTPLDKIPEAAARKIAPPLGKEWRNIFNVSRALAVREQPGMPGPKQTAAQIARWKKFL
ncbi:MAG TPA: argininosuccinate lyase [Opitutales bacterium]|jgi:argininosuccinate lyase|nr:argininosuccinate lyase [Opitutales bacterium]